MGKVSQKDTQDLIDSGILSKKALTAMKEKNLVAKTKELSRGL